jgi:hypothetical protein
VGKCKDDIHTLHAELIHKAADIQFQLAYLNGLDPATITDLPNGKNVQRLIEQYFSKVGIPILNEIPGGIKNNVNLVYTTAFEFVPGTLQVFLSGLKLNGDQLDPDRDYDVTTVGLNAYKEFTIILAPNKHEGLNSPPKQKEPLYVTYGKRITFDTKGGT